MDIAVIDRWLELVEELRGRLERIAAHERRIQGMLRDRAEFDASLVAPAADAGMEPPDDPARTLEALRIRVAAARSVAQEIGTLETERKKHQTDMDRPATERTIARDRLGPFLARVGIDGAADLPP